MRFATIILSLGLFWGAVGLPCDATYYLQGATQYIRTEQVRTTRTVLGTVTTQLPASLAGITVIDTHTAYTIIKQVKPDCAGAVKNSVTYATRASMGPRTFKDTVRTDLFVDMFDSSELRLPITYYMTLALDSDTVAGRIPGGVIQYLIPQAAMGQPFVLWYGAVLLNDSLRSGTGRWNYVGGKYLPQAQSVYDSATMDDMIIASLGLSGYKTDSLHGYLKLQMLKVEYDTLPAAAVSFRPGDFGLTSTRGLSVMRGKPAVVYDIMGRVVGRLTPANRVSLPAGSGYCIVRSQDKQFTVTSVRMQK
jgi:hypothetical protein